MSFTAVVLAAGKGTRMKSELAKPLHQLCGRTMLGWVIASLDPARFEAVSIVVGHGGEQVTESVKTHSSDRSFVFAEQVSQRGTGDATTVGLTELDSIAPSYSDDDHVLVLPGDTPLLRRDTVDALALDHISSGVACTVLTAHLDDAGRYGRIVRSRDGQSVERIVEHSDADSAVLALTEFNSAMYCFRRSLLAPALRKIDSNNAQGELYLTDVIEVLVQAGHQVKPFVTDATEVGGVNDREQLSLAGVEIAERIVQGHMRNGVTVVQPASTLIEADVEIAPDVVINPGSVLAAKTRIGAGAVIGPNTHLVDATIGSGATVPSCVIEGAEVASGESLAPFTQLRGP